MFNARSRALSFVTGLSVLGVTGAAPAIPSKITATTDGHVLKRFASNALGFGAAYKAVVQTDTGTLNNWAPGLVGDTIILWNGGANATITGIVAGYDGQTVMIRNVSTFTVLLAHNNGSSSAGNRLSNMVSAASTPVAAGGYATYVYSTTFSIWVLVGHDQGGWLTTPFNAANYTAFAAGTWTVASGDVAANSYRLSGRTLSWNLSLFTTTVVRSGPDPTVLVVNPASVGSFTPIGATSPVSICRISDNGTAAAGVMQWNGSNFLFTLINGGQWANATDTTALNVLATFEVN